jgi:GNAT superfamily N-acetyltransferase
MYFKLFFYALVILISTITIFVLYRQTKKSIETFTAGPESYIREVTEEYQIIPFKECSKEVQKDVIEHLQKEWKDTGVVYTIDFINETWKYPDAIYVMINEEGEFIGCSALDRKYMGYPFISHIYVKKEYRKKGYGEKLFKFIIKYSKHAGHKQVYGFCQNELVDYYKTFGCTKLSATGLLKPFIGGFNLLTLKI